MITDGMGLNAAYVLLGCDRNFIWPGSSLITVPGCLHCTLSNRWGRTTCHGVLVQPSAVCLRSWPLAAAGRDLRSLCCFGCSGSRSVNGAWCLLSLKQCWNIYEHKVVYRISGFSYVLVCSFSNFLLKSLIGNVFLILNKAIKIIPSSSEE